MIPASLHVRGRDVWGFLLPEKGCTQNARYSTAPATMRNEMSWEKPVSGRYGPYAVILLAERAGKTSNPKGVAHSVPPATTGFCWTEKSDLRTDSGDVNQLPFFRNTRGPAEGGGVPFSVIEGSKIQLPAPQRNANIACPGGTPRVQTKE